MVLARTKTKIGPQHHGRKMSLKAFEFVQVDNGHLYELARGYIVVSEVANLPHARQTALIRNHLGHYQIENPDSIYVILGTMECKLYIPDWESERHPDIAVYLAAPPKGRQDRTIW